MVHVNSTYVMDAIYDQLYKIKKQKISKSKFYDMVLSQYKQSYFDYLDELKDKNTMMNYPFRKFLELESTKKMQWSYVSDHQEFWWDWFD